jgi:tetratricopeptide (TPR) repeat protein
VSPVWRLFAGPPLAALVMAALFARPVPAAQASASGKATALSRLDRLQAWVTAVEQHQAGVADGPVIEINQWTAAELRQTWIDLNSLVTLIRDPRAGVFFYTEPARPADNRQRPSNVRPVRWQIFYSRSELDRLRAMAQPRIGDGGDNRLLKRGALLHADLAMIAPGTGRSAPRNPGSGPLRFTLYMADGRHLGSEDAVSHWEIGRWLLDTVTPGPSADEDVRLWYLATSAFMQHQQQLALPHFERALALFPSDPDVLFQVACLHEMLAAAAVQAAVRAARLPRDRTLDVTTEREELRTAERYYRRALEARPGMIEPRIRLGRVLGRLDRPKDAVGELRLAVSKAVNPLLLYYGLLFLGAQLEVLGNHEEARTSYERAAALYPLAQAPALALSQLAARAGNHAAARDAVRPVFDRPGDPDDSDDPWWLYHTTHARSVVVLLPEMYRAFDRGGQR